MMKEVLLMSENSSNKHILSDKDLMELSESAPMPEGGTLEQFLQEADVVAQAVQATGVKLQQLHPSSRALFLMRAFYLLGVLRGGESYRGEMCITDDVDWEAECCPFALVSWAAEDMAEELNNPEIEDRNLLIQLLELEGDAQ